MVSFTPNISLEKPTNSELATDWIEGTQHLPTNNAVIKSKADIVLTPYTPVLGAQTTPPGVGAGAIRGEYLEVQGFVMGSFVVEFTDPGIVAGSGEFGISLPVPVDTTYHAVAGGFNSAVGNFSCIGEGYIFDNSNVSLSGTIALDSCVVSGTYYARMITETFAAPVKTNRVFAAGMPSNISNNDKWSGSFFYKRM